MKRTYLKYIMEKKTRSVGNSGLPTQKWNIKVEKYLKSGISLVYFVPRYLRLISKFIYFVHVFWPDYCASRVTHDETAFFVDIHWP